MRGAILFVCLLGSLTAQSQTIYFSTKFAETPASGRGGNITDLTPVCGTPTLPNPQFGVNRVIESAVSNSQGLNAVIPGVPNILPLGQTSTGRVTDFIEIANIPQFNLIIGDLDRDGVVHEGSNFEGVNAVHVAVARSGRLNNLHEVFVSADGNSRGNQGFIGSIITAADVIRLPAATNAYPLPQQQVAPEYFIRRTDWGTIFQINAPSTMNVNAFTVEQSSGDIYVSFDTPVAGVTVNDAQGMQSIVTLSPGDIVRVPGPNTTFGLQAGYTASGPSGVVTNPVPGSAELIFTEAEVQAMVANAGCSINVGAANVFGLQANTTGAFAFPMSGFISAELQFTVDNSGGSAGSAASLPCATAVYSTANSGSYAVVNGIVMDQPSSMGIADLSFNQGFNTGPLDALAIIENPGADPVSGRGIHLDAYPTNGVVSDPLYSGVLTTMASGVKFTGPSLAVFMSVKAVARGGWAERWSLAGTGITGYPDLYVDPLGVAESCAFVVPTLLTPFCQFPAFQSIFTNGLNPVWPFVDPTNGQSNGDTCFALDLSSVLPAGSMPFSASTIVIAQALDMFTQELSAPISFTLN